LVTSPLYREGQDERTSTAERVPAPGSDDPLGEVSDRDFHDLLLRRLKQLISVKDYQIYHLITFDGWTPVQVADHFKMRRGTIDTIICRTRQTARRELERLGEKVG